MLKFWIYLILRQHDDAKYVYQLLANLLADFYFPNLQELS
jgi:hypothetical protein